MTKFLRKVQVLLLAMFMVSTVTMVMPTLSSKSEAASKKYVVSLKIKGKVQVEKGKKVAIKPTIKIKGKTSKVVTVKSKNKKIAKVSYSKKKNSITIKGIKPGKTTITVTTKAQNKKGKKITKKIKVTVIESSASSEEKRDGYATVSGTLKSKSGTLIKENINICFAKKADYEAGAYSPISTTIHNSTGEYSIELSNGEYVALLGSVSHNGVSYSSENEKLGEVTVSDKDKFMDLIYDGYYISGKWLRNNSPMDEAIYVDVTLSNGLSSNTNDVTVIKPDANGHFYFLCDSYYSEYDKDKDLYGLDVEKLSFTTDSYSLKTVKPYTEDMTGVTWENDYYIVKGTVLNHGSNQIYGLYYSGLSSNSTYLCSWNDSDEIYDRVINAYYNFTDAPDRDEVGDYKFVMGVPAGAYKLKMGTALSTNEIIVNKDMNDVVFAFDAYAVSFSARYTGVAGDTIEESPRMYIYQDGEEIHSISYEYINYEPIYLSPGTYEIRLKQCDSPYPQKIQEFTVTDSDKMIEFSY